MKINKRVLSICLAVMLVVAMAIPASAYTNVVARYYGDISYATSDTCNLRNFSCVIEGWDGGFTVCTNVETWTDSIRQLTVYGTPQEYLSSTSRSVGYAMSHIICHYLIDGEWADSGRTDAS